MPRTILMCSFKINQRFQNYTFELNRKVSNTFLAAKPFLYDDVRGETYSLIYSASTADSYTLWNCNLLAWPYKSLLAVNRQCISWL